MRSSCESSLSRSSGSSQLKSASFNEMAGLPTCCSATDMGALLGSVMPGLDPGIASRGWPGQAGHDAKLPPQPNRIGPELRPADRAAGLLGGLVAGKLAVPVRRDDAVAGLV